MNPIPMLQMDLVEMCVGKIEKACNRLVIARLVHPNVGRIEVLGEETKGDVDERQREGGGMSCMSASKPPYHRTNF